jgi:hypothetical protein
MLWKQGSHLTWERMRSLAIITTFLFNWFHFTVYFNHSNALVVLRSRCLKKCCHWILMHIKRCSIHYQGTEIIWRLSRASFLIKLNSVAWVRERTIPTERPPLVGEVSENLWDKGRHVVSMTDICGLILGFLHSLICWRSLTQLSILSRVGVTIDGVWISNWIYWPLTTRHCK